MAWLGYPNSLEVPVGVLKGGMIFAWRRGVEFDLVVMNQNLISIVLFVVSSFQPWAISFVHCPCEWREKEVFWEELDGIGRLFAGPWLVMGDFNALSGQHEKI